MAFNQIPMKYFAVMVSIGLVAGPGCTKKNESGSVHVTMPPSVGMSSSGTGVVAAPTAGTNTWNTALNPTAGSDLNCYAIFIAGSGLDSSTCQFSNAGVVSTVSFGPFAGLIAQGSETTIDVAPGADRVIHIVGFHVNSASDCTKNQIPGTMDNSVLSEPFVIASQPTVIPPGPSTVTIQPVLNLQNKVVDCKIAGSTGAVGGGTGNNVISWGDKRDGTIELSGTSGNTLTTGANNYLETLNLKHSPQSGGVASSKLFGASRQITNIDNVTAQTLTLGASFIPNEFEVGDEVLWYVSAGNSSVSANGMTAPDDPDIGACGSSLYRGRYGTSKIASVSATGTSVTLTSPLADVPAKIKNANLVAPITGTDFCRISLNRIPNFDQIKVNAGSIWTWTPPPYVPSTGTDGIVVLRTTRLEVNGNLKIDASGKGYSGGISNNSGGSINGPGLGGSVYPNSSGGGSSVNGSGSGAGGAGAGQGGNFGLSAFGGTPLNYCENSNYLSVASGTSYACGIADDGDLKCWGYGASGVLGDGTLSNRSTPSNISGGLKFDVVATGATHSCAIQKLTGKLYCWGSNIYGQLGDGTSIDHMIPGILDTSNSYKTVAVGSSSTCAITTTGLLRCWGYGIDGEIGNGANVNIAAPVTIDPTIAYDSVSGGGKHFCALTTAGQLKCWGDNTSGQLGDGTTTARNIPTTIGTGFTFVSAGKGNSTCAITGGIIKCWGENIYSQLGDGTATSRVTPSPVASNFTFQSVSVAVQHVCGVTSDQHLMCWGGNSSAMLGDGTYTVRSIPTAIDATTTYASVSTSASNTCATTTTGQLKCWGQNTFGQVGNGAASGYVILPINANTQKTCLPLTNQKAYFGGGGGGSVTSFSGASGGGLILLFAKEVIGTGTLAIVANGADGVGSVSTVTSGGGGGGGGTLSIATRFLRLNSVGLIAAGGLGYDGGASMSSGGGGGGSIEIKTCGVDSDATSLASLGLDAKGGLGFTGSDAGAVGHTERSDITATCTYN